MENSEAGARDATPGGRPDYGIDAPAVLRNLFLAGIAGLVLGLAGPQTWTMGSATFVLRPMFLGIGIVFLAEASLYLLYVKYGKLRHRDRMLGLHAWRGDERVLDVGCGRGLLLAGAAKRAPRGAATGVDIWSQQDMGGNSEAATWRNLRLEGVSERCALISGPAQTMPFPDHAFDVVVSNLCLHNIKHKAERERALEQIVRVLRPGGTALISDYKLTGEYQAAFRRAGLDCRRVWGNPLYTFPPLRIVVARKGGQ